MTTTETEVILAPITAIPLGEGRAFEIAGERVAVFRTRADGVFAVQAECPHRAGPLADGLLGGTTLVCPLHAAKFDLRTGEPLNPTQPSGSCRLKTYPVRLDTENRVLLKITD